jgi:predicted nucleotidyltransferase component of viral defense system
MKKPLTNMAASVQDRLRTMHRQTGEDYQLLLNRFVQERLLYRLSQSEHRDRFILKGAMMFVIWHGSLHRVTRDMDLLGFGTSSIPALEAIFRELAQLSVEDDGVVFDAATIQGEQIRSQEAYVGVRLTLTATIGRARVPLQVDVGFGDATPASPVEVDFPSLLGLPSARVRSYRMETSIAEKYEALVSFGLLNSRMKDYWDFWFLAKHFDFDGQVLATAIGATFARRERPLPTALPVGLTDKFSTDPNRQTVWRAFWRKSIKTEPMIPLAEMVTACAAFLGPPALAAAFSEPFVLRWLADKQAWG